MTDILLLSKNTLPGIPIEWIMPELAPYAQQAREEEQDYHFHVTPSMPIKFTGIRPVTEEEVKYLTANQELGVIESKSAADDVPPTDTRMSYVGCQGQMIEADPRIMERFILLNVPKSKGKS